MPEDHDWRRGEGEGEGKQLRQRQKQQTNMDPAAIRTVDGRKPEQN